MSLRSVVVVLALSAATSAEAQTARRWSTLEAFLTEGVGLTRSQLASLAKGEVVGKQLAAGDPGDVGVIGIVQIDVPRSVFVERQLQITTSARSASRPVARTFSYPATASDVSEFDVTNSDLRALRNCRPDDCKLKLSAAEMMALRPAARGDNARSQVNAAVARRLAEIVNDYRRRGDDGAIVYDDRGSVRSRDAFMAMIRDSTYLHEALPSLARFFAGYPRDSLPGARESIFWSIDDMPRVRPVLRVLHAILYSPPEFPGTSALAVRQIYANHYFEAGAELLLAVDRWDGTRRDGITLIAVRRFRFDHLPTGGILNIRGRVRDGMLSGTITDLEHLKRDYEPGWKSKADASRSPLSAFVLIKR